MQYEVSRRVARESGRPARDRDVTDLVARGYDAVAHDYARLERERAWPRMRWLTDLLDRLPEASDVLDVGCGAGVPAAREIAEQHRATGVDVSRVQVALARQNAPNARLIRADVMDVEFARESFDAIVAFYVLDHVPREEHARLLERMHGWLRPGGFLLLAVEAEDEPGFVGDWLGAPMFFSHFDAETTLALLRRAGFAIVRDAVESQNEGGRDVEYTWVLAQKRSSPLVRE